MQKIKRIALEIDWERSFAGRAKGNRHLFRMVKLAVWMASKLRANIPIVEAAAWLHDIALPSGNDYNYAANKQAAMAVLKRLQLPARERVTIAACVASHEGTGPMRTLEAKIVHDADVLEKSGILGIIRHTWKVSHGEGAEMDESAVERILHHVRWRATRLQTRLAKNMHAYVTVPLSALQAKKLVLLVALKATRGLTTEKIARALLATLSAKQKAKLQEQLTLTYLKRF
ncbi:MAG: HD domain-containing protein [Patescibacteria group bacterium]